jgi:hypothetical protein
MSTPRNTGRTPLRASRIARVVTALGRAVVVGGLATIVACSDTPSTLLGPQDGAATRDVVRTTGSSTAVKVSGLLRDVPLRTAQTRSWTIRSNRGDVMHWPEMGLTVVVPPKAFSAAEMTFTITALPGDVIAYDFGPDGSRFNVPLTVVQSLKETNFEKLSAKLGRDAQLRGAYFRNAAQVDDASNSALVDEFLPAELGFHGWFVSFQVTHFSGYMVSTN